MSNYETEPQKFSCTRICVKINTRIQVRTWICSGWVLHWGWRDQQQQSILLYSIPHAYSHQQSQPGVGCQHEKLVGRHTKTSSGKSHRIAITNRAGSIPWQPWFSSQAPVVLETHRVCYHYGNPCWEIKRVPEVLEHPLICTPQSLYIPKPLQVWSSHFWSGYNELPKKQEERSSQNAATTELS